MRSTSSVSHTRLPVRGLASLPLVLVCTAAAVALIVLFFRSGEAAGQEGKTPKKGQRPPVKKEARSGEERRVPPAAPHKSVARERPHRNSKGAAGAYAREASAELKRLFEALLQRVEKGGAPPPLNKREVKGFLDLFRKHPEVIPYALERIKNNSVGYYAQTGVLVAIGELGPVKGHAALISFVDSDFDDPRTLRVTAYGIIAWPWPGQKTPPATMDYLIDRYQRTGKKTEGSGVFFTVADREWDRDRELRDRVIAASREMFEGAFSGKRTAWFLNPPRSKPSTPSIDEPYVSLHPLAPVLEVLARAEGDAEKAAYYLAPYLAHKNEEVRYSALSALISKRFASKRAEELVIERIWKEPTYIHFKALDWLKTVCPEAAGGGRICGRVSGAIIRVMHGHPVTHVRLWAIGVLSGTQGGKDYAHIRKEVMAALETVVASDDDRFNRESAAENLEVMKKEIQKR